MGRIAPVVLFLALAACASGPPPAPPTPRPVAPPAASAAPAPRQVSPTSAARGGYAQEVDDLFRALDAGDGLPAPAQARAPGQPTREVIYVIAPVSPERAAAEAQEAQQRAYEENLTGCLDGRFPAFCDHAQLTPYDAARVQQAEYEANLAACLDSELSASCNRATLSPADAARVHRTELEANLTACIDPDQQHLCRPELPDVMQLPSQAPAYRPAPARVLERSTSGVSPRRAMAAAVSPERVIGPATDAVAATPSTNIRPQATARPARVQPRQAAPPPHPATPARFASVQATALPASAIAERMIRASIAAYPGRCPCPYNRDRAGRQCGGRSAYWRIGGYSPICYPRDVTPEMIEEFRARKAG